MKKILCLMPVMAMASACAMHTGQDEPSRGLTSVNMPVVDKTAYAYDVAQLGSDIPASEEQRLADWFTSLNLGYGDTIHLDGPVNPGTRNDVARLAGRYGLLLSPGAPVTAGAIEPGNVRVIVQRTRAFVPDCPDWREPSNPSWNNRTAPNYGCALNANMAAMVANPDDLIMGRQGSGVADTRTSSRAVQTYRDAEPSGTGGLAETGAGGGGGGGGANSGGQ